MSASPKVFSPRLVSGISILLFVFSLTGTCFCTEGRCIGSFEALLMGWFAVLLSLGGLAWLANPLLVLAWIFEWKQLRYSWIFSMLAMIFGLSFLAAKTIVRDEAGHMEKITGVQGSYWLWLSASIVQFAGSLYFMLIKRRRSSDNSMESDKRA